MKQYLIQYKPFLMFLAKFFLTYIVLTIIYQFYLNTFEGNKTDSITQLVAKNTEQLMHFFNADLVVVNDSESYIKLIYKQQYLARIIEGCNAISVIILFASFIVAFSGKVKQTLFFIITGSIVIYILNVIRIALLVVLMYNYPQEGELLHGTLFPLFIYGVVFILWVIWVNKFSLYAKKTIRT
ncbi:exosortase family protein XrtF [Flavobacterium sp. 7E]|uniref:exosortase family protein XrtF n=1 Tax=Flavobacterium sp. 7E TaxID=2735898 RepID=UPI00156DCBC7|nr:exosortase family protein XrtF [Flavobacterium sp. 7E]NRS90045.1 exosortase family protein XrtF [Flavobacterium sp. 7E]